jgi:hypothetical protein
LQKEREKEKAKKALRIERKGERMRSIWSLKVGKVSDGICNNEGLFAAFDS